MQSGLEVFQKEHFPKTVDAVLILSPISRRYLLGFPSSAGSLVLLPDRQVFIVDFRYIEAARKNIRGCEVLLQENLFEQINQLLTQHGVKSCAIEEQYVTLASFAKLQKQLPSVTLCHDARISASIDAMRVCKTAEEILHLKKAQEMTDTTLVQLVSRIQVGMSEKELANELEYLLKANGSEGLSFDTIAVAGVNSSLPHGHPSDYRLQQGDFVTLDFGAMYRGYHADLTRTIALGSVSEKQTRIYNIVLRAQLEALAGIRAGARCADIDKIARDIIAKEGYGDYFGHGLGHSVGLEIHEEPRFSLKSEAVLREGMVLTIEPGIYLPGEFGVRIEDVVIVTSSGCDNITKSPKVLEQMTI